MTTKTRKKLFKTTQIHHQKQQPAIRIIKLNYKSKSSDQEQIQKIQYSRLSGTGPYPHPNTRNSTEERVWTDTSLRIHTVNSLQIGKKQADREPWSKQTCKMSSSISFRYSM